MALIYGLAGAGNAVAADALYLDPSRIECKVTQGYRDAKRADVYYDGLRIHEGREMDEATANGDYVTCTSVVERAVSLGRNVVMMRGHVYDGHDADWDIDGFFTVEDSE